MVGSGEGGGADDRGTGEGGREVGPLSGMRRVVDQDRRGAGERRAGYHVREQGVLVQRGVQRRCEGRGGAEGDRGGEEQEEGSGGEVTLFERGQRYIGI